MQFPSRVSRKLARQQPKVFLTLLLTLPYNVQSSPSSGAEFSSRPRDLSSGSQSGLSRQLQVTPGAQIRGDLLVEVPFTVMLPTIGFNTEYKSRWREKRQGKHRRFPEADAQKIHINRLEEEKDPIDYEEEGFSKLQTSNLLSRVDTLFYYLQVHDETCRERAICEIVQNRLKYSPLSDILVSLFRKSRSFSLIHESPNLIRWDRYFYAGSLGLDSDGEEQRCQARYNSCDMSVDQMLNLPALKIWQLLADKVFIRITDQ